jgi:hypothetical protein
VSRVVVGATISFLLIAAAAAIGLGHDLSRRDRPLLEAKIELAPTPVNVGALAALLRTNAQAAGLAGYPAMVEPSKRRATAAQAAVKVEALIADVQEVDSPYAARQAQILQELRAGLQAYAQGAGTARLGAASAANAQLREELSSLGAWVGLPAAGERR